MKNLSTIILVALLVILIVFYGGSYKKGEDRVSGVSSIPSNSITTDGTWGISAKWKLLKSGYGSLDTVVITGGTLAADLNFYDATTTTSHLDHPTTTVGVIKASSPAGTYSFGSAFARGLVAEWTTAIGPASSTITWQ